MELTRSDHLLIRLAEECNEVARRASKAILFTLDKVQPDTALGNNAKRLTQELQDLVAVMEMLQDEKFIPPINRLDVGLKKLKVEKYIQYSNEVRKN